MLGTFHLTGDHDAGGQVGDPDGTVGPVDVLSAGAAGTIGIDLQIFFIDFDIEIFIEFRKSIGRSERGVAPGVAVERRNTDKPVDAAFGFQIAVSEFAFDTPI